MMLRALNLARAAAELGEIPVGAVITRGSQIIAQAHNLREVLRDPTAHAECLALRMASRTLSSWRLDRCTVYVTLEPCPMCAGALVQSRVSRLVYGATDTKTGACESLYRLTADRRLNHQLEVTGGLLEDQCGEILRGFFLARRTSPDCP